MSPEVKVFAWGCAIIAAIYFYVFNIEPSGDCDDPQIKGNRTTYNGEKIYHLPSGQFYNATNAEQMFCTEEDARAAGYRRSQR